MKDITAVSFPSSGQTNPDANIYIARDITCIFSSLDQLQRLPTEHMVQIRKIMMQHEELFKEQVQALHKLYNIQRSVMQEIRTHFPAQMLSPDSYTAEGNAKVETLPTAQDKLRRKIDLERPPEEYMDDSDYQAEADIFYVQDANTSFSGRIQNTVESSFLGSNQSVPQTHDPSLNQKNVRHDYKTTSEPTQETNSDLGQDLEAKIETVYIKKCTAGIHSLQQALRNNTLQELPWNHLHEDGNSPLYEDSNGSLDQHSRRTSWLIQDSPPFTAQKFNCTRNSDFIGSEAMRLGRKASEQVKESSPPPMNAHCPSLTQLNQALESNCSTIPHLKLDQAPQDSDTLVPSGEDCPQASLTNKWLQTNAKKINSFCIWGFPFSETDLPSLNCNLHSQVLSFQTGEDDRIENPNCSGHGSNSPVSPGVKVCKDEKLVIFAAKSPAYDSDCEPIQMGHVVEEGFLSEAEEMPRSTNNDIISPASPIPSSETNSKDHSCCSKDKQKYAAEANDIVNSPESVTNQEEPVIVKGNKDLKNKFTEEEACESIAAKILLSFATCRLQSDDKWQGFKTQVEVESVRMRRGSTGNEKKQYQHVRRGLNSNKGAVKWKKSVSGSRRRSSRRLM